MIDITKGITNSTAIGVNDNQIPLRLLDNATPFLRYTLLLYKNQVIFAEVRCSSSSDNFRLKYPLKCSYLSNCDFLQISQKQGVINIF